MSRLDGLAAFLLFVVPVFFTTFFAIEGNSLADPLYVIEKPDGVTVFTTRKPRFGQTYRVFTTKSSSNAKSIRFELPMVGENLSKRAFVYSELISRTSIKYGVEPALVKAVVHVESGFNPSATSSAGAMGLMQLMPATAKRFGVSNAYEPISNLDAGVRYLRFLLDRYNGNRLLALAAYNSGEMTVDRKGAIPEIEETIRYVKNVLKIREFYRT